MAAARAKLQVVIIGGGAAGTLLANELYARLPGRCCVTLIDRTGRFGRGIAYSAPAPWHRLNVPAYKMGGLREDGSYDFVEWLKRRGFSEPRSYSDWFVPRATYGDFLAESLERLKSAGALTECRADITTVEWRGDRYILLTPEGDHIESDVVALCLGNPASAGLPQVPVSDRLIGDPWQPGALDAIAADDRVLIVGTAATAIDVAIDLVHRKRAAEIIMTSRKGLLPRLDAPPQTHPPLRLARPVPPMRRLMQSLRTEIANAPVDTSWQTIFDAFRANVEAIWQSSNDEERSRFLRHLRSIWLVHRHRLAPDIDDLLSRLQSEGRVTVYAGRLHDVRATDAGFSGAIQRRETSRTFAVEWIINCTGPQDRYDRLNDPLVNQLLEAGHVRLGPMNLGLAVDENGRVLGANNQPCDNLYALGPPTRGTFWEITAIPWIRANAARVAQHIETTCRS